MFFWTVLGFILHLASVAIMMDAILFIRAEWRGLTGSGMPADQHAGALIAISISLGASFILWVIADHIAPGLT